MPNRTYVLFTPENRLTSTRNRYPETMARFLNPSTITYTPQPQFLRVPRTSVINWRVTY